MKNFLIAILIIGGAMTASYYEHHYLRKDCNVIEVCNNNVTVVDSTNNVWCFKGTKYSIGDNVTLKMYTNGTINRIDDDKIIGVIKNRKGE